MTNIVFSAEVSLRDSLVKEWLLGKNGCIFPADYPASDVFVLTTYDGLTLYILTLSPLAVNFEDR